MVGSGRARGCGRSFVMALIAAVAAVSGCSAANGGSGEETEQTSQSRVEALSSADAIARAREWVDAGMPYCSGPNGGADLICGGTCWRGGAAASPAWDAYRSDCSGLVSYAWGLPAPGRTTYGFAPFDTGVSYAIAGKELQPGDALNSSGHIVLFAGWVDQGAGRARILEEYNCGQVATDHVLTLWVDGSSSVYVSDWSPKDYTAIRYVNAEAASDGNNTGACGDVDYAGYCDGDTLVWCEDGGLRSYDCAANGKACGFQDDATGNNCIAAEPVTPPSGCGDVDYAGYCDGDTLVWCENDVVQTYGCDKAGMICGWEDDVEGNNCL